MSSLWEALRQFGRPASVREIATVLQRSEPKVIESLDALRQVRLVRRIAATGRHPEIRFAPTVQRIVLAWDPKNSLHQAIHSQIGGVFEAAYAPAPEGGVLPSIRGRAWITGEGTLVVDEADPYRHGIPAAQRTQGARTR